MKKRVLFLRPYYGFNVHTDAHGELGMKLDKHDIYPDLTLLTAATVFVESKEYEVRVIDAIAQERMLPDELLKKIENDTFDIVIVKAAGSTIHSDLTLIRAIREMMPQADIKICGLAAKILKKWLDKNASYINEVITEPVDEYAYEYVTGKKGSFVDLPMPDYTLVDYKSYRDAKKGLRLTIIGSRGCPMSCLYCPYKQYYEAYEQREAKQIVAEMKKLIKLGADEIQFRDQYFSANKEKTRELLETIIKEGIKTKIVCETRLESLDEDMLLLMKKAGVSMICFGVESGDEMLLYNYNSVKGVTKRVKELVDFAQGIGIETMAFYIIGFPEETWDMAKSTYELAEFLDTTYVHFNEYEHCHFDIENTEYTPDLFLPFENRTAMEYPSILGVDEIQYLVYLFEIRYAMRTSYEAAYRDCYKVFYDNRRAVEKLSHFVDDLYHLSECARELREEGWIDA